MKIYTKTGDKGLSSLFAGGRVTKAHPRMMAYGAVDELNSSLGVVLAEGVASKINKLIERVQVELLELGADLATPIDKDSPRIKRIPLDYVERLEKEIDDFTQDLPELHNFILPGGSRAGAHLHLARTICRRAERKIVMLWDQEEINDNDIVYINRLSDWLFTLARLQNQEDQTSEQIWKG